MLLFAALPSNKVAAPNNPMVLILSADPKHGSIKCHVVLSLVLLDLDGNINKQEVRSKIFHLPLLDL
jgi:hypothetical protein